MNRLRVLMRSSTLRSTTLLGSMVGAAALALAVGGLASGCGDDGNNTGGAGGTTSSTGSGPQGGGGSGGGPTTDHTCKKAAAGPTRGSAIAVTPDDSRVVAVNRAKGSVTIFDAEYDAKGVVKSLKKYKELPVGGEPWQVAIDGCGSTAYVVLRKDQKVVAIDHLDGSPTVGDAVDVGSEPTSLALTPNNTKLYVANWVDGTLAVIDPVHMKKTGTVDLNDALVASPKNYFGSGQPSRPSLAHPRSIAITHDGTKDEDETVYVTEFFGQRIAAEPSLPVGGVPPTTPIADVTHEGVLYAVGVKDDEARTISLAPLQDTGFTDHNGGTTGCYPNQLQGVSINGHYAYVTAICASPQGPLGVFQKGACTTTADCSATPGSVCDTTTAGLGAAGGAGACTLQCTTDAQCGVGGTCLTAVTTPPGSGSCKPNVTDVKATTHPVMLIVDTRTGAEVGVNARTNLNKAFVDLYGPVTAASPDDATRRLPLVANEVAFVGGTFGYTTANGADAVFRFTTDTDGTIASVGAQIQSKTVPFIDLAPAAFAPEDKGEGPIGVAAGHKHPILFTDNGQTFNVTGVDLTAQVVAGGNSPIVAQSSDLPTDDAGKSALAGKRFFETGMGRWSLKGQGWGSCQNCHVDGLTDNVTWYFNRGPRQSVSLDGTFNKKDPSDQRILNWTAIFDEVADFENNTRGVSGGLGALVHPVEMPPQIADRLNLNDKTLYAPDGANGLSGSTSIIDTASVAGVQASDNPNNWKAIADWIKTKVRSPRAPSNLDAGDVAAGLTLFKTGNCQGCHGGDKWTVSKMFYQPSDSGTTATNPNHLLLGASWGGAALAANPPFPASMLPAGTGNQFMRSLNGNGGALDQLTCILRNVGTFTTSPAEVNVQEIRQDMKTLGQGSEVTGTGFNPPSLLNLQAGAPYFHAGNARSLEEMFSGGSSSTALFAAHTNALNTNAVFLGNEDVKKLVAYLLSIDDQTKTIAAPSKASSLGGDFCSPTDNDG